VSEMVWYGHLIIWVIFFALGTGFGVIYKGRKLKPIIAVLKDSSLSTDVKLKKILDLLT
jgi:hypothetical protein